MSLPDIYLLHGWKANMPELKAALMDMGQEAADRDVKVVFTRDGKSAFLGHVLVAVNASEGLSFGDVPAPTAERTAELRAAIQRMKLVAVAKEDPRLWVVVG